jgi:hypothetical protein
MQLRKNDRGEWQGGKGTQIPASVRGIYRRRRILRFRSNYRGEILPANNGLSPLRSCK